MQYDVNLIKNARYPLEVVIGVVYLFEDIENASLALPHCLKAWTSSSWDYQGYAKACEVPKDSSRYIKVVTTDITIGGFSILRDTNAAVAAFLVNDYETFGKKFGAIMKLVENVKQDENLFLY